RVTLLDTTPDVVKVTTDVLESLVARLGISVMVNLKQAQNETYSGPVFNLEGEDSGLLIGRKGETLKAFQFLVKFIVGEKLGDRANLLVDVEDYQERRYRALRNLAQRVAQRVAATGRSITLEPMPPDERRVVHLTLADNPDVSTESTGFGGGRQVVVRPKRG
ncbi:MAG: KH domain-containing protein, partial [Chloroflexi bacterium]|nr:KH domain-containing protein [Chloroflexota bacterium]